ncbi:hypothetical protein HID58_054313 [Brassica napus]|uniref:B box-type domain-containing protein n=3 Tax=Brassica TaxID=3705 RepID=A0ABQ8AH55_BRANA|nr:hypothetical protein HID58_054313 [Brassica napus]
MLSFASAKNLGLSFSLGYCKPVIDSCEQCPVNSHVATVYCTTESRYVCGMCGLNCLRQKHSVHQIVEQPVVHQGQEEQNVGGRPLPRAEIQRQNRRLAAIRLDLKRPIRKKTAPKIKVAAKLREKYAKERFARKDDPKDDGASGAAAVN